LQRKAPKPTVYKEKSFFSPSIAAAAVSKHVMNGWKVWTFERAPGDWVSLNALRK